MEFSEAISRIESVLKNTGSDISQNEYDGLIVKKLEASNTLDRGRSTNQTHIAISGSQMDMFPYVRADAYFDMDYDKQDQTLKKYFIAQIPVYLHKENVSYLDDQEKIFDEDERLVHVSIVRSRRNNAADQIQMSMTNVDSPEYVAYRKLVHAKTYMILLKRKQQLLYDLYSVTETDGDPILKDLNNGFFKLATNTPVKIDEINAETEETVSRKVLSFDSSKNCAKQIVDCIYEIDSFSRIADLMENTEKYIKIKSEEIGGNYLRYMFAKPESSSYEPSDTGKARVFTDKEYSITLEDTVQKCRLSTEWVSTPLGGNGTSANYLLSLIDVINRCYSGILNIYVKGNELIIERLSEPFTLEKMPDIFQSSFARRYITSLLSKPFVILTGNSGTGKTRLSKQFAEYLTVHSADEEKNWVLIPVGADWTDNTKILGFYNPLADEGKGRYEKTEILRLIERANADRTKPYFIILDEMNLSRVERYFSDFLSHMETGDIPFVLDGYDGCVEYPSNLFVTGTVNIDDTTYMFSPKVLDRANVIEFRPDEDSVMDLFLKSVRTEEIKPGGRKKAKAFMDLASSIQSGTCNLEESSLEEVQTLFRQIYEITEKYGYEFAYRTVKEIRQYIAAAYELLEDKSKFDLTAAEDEQLLQKVLPKIHGNRKEIGQLLNELEELCVNNNLKLSEKKIKQMKGKLANVQYASFI